MSAKKKLATMAAALLVGAVVAVPVRAAETLKLKEVSHLHGIAVDPTDPSRLYLASHHGVWLTNPERLYAVTDKSAILASQDGGKTWTPFRS